MKLNWDKNKKGLNWFWRIGVGGMLKQPSLESSGLYIDQRGGVINGDGQIIMTPSFFHDI